MITGVHRVSRRRRFEPHGLFSAVAALGLAVVPLASPTGLVATTATATIAGSSAGAPFTCATPSIFPPSGRRLSITARSMGRARPRSKKSARLMAGTTTRSATTPRASTSTA